MNSVCDPFDREQLKYSTTPVPCQYFICIKIQILAVYLFIMHLCMNILHIDNAENRLISYLGYFLPYWHIFACMPRGENRSPRKDRPLPGVNYSALCKKTQPHTAPSPGEGFPVFRFFAFSLSRSSPGKAMVEKTLYQ